MTVVAIRWRTRQILLSYLDATAVRTLPVASEITLFHRRPEIPHLQQRHC